MSSIHKEAGSLQVTNDELFQVINPSRNKRFADNQLFTLRRLYRGVCADILLSETDTTDEDPQAVNLLKKVAVRIKYRLLVACIDAGVREEAFKILQISRPTPQPHPNQ